MAIWLSCADMLICVLPCVSRPESSSSANKFAIAPADCAATMSRPTLFKWLKRAESRTITPGRKWRPPNHWLCRRKVRDAVRTGLLVAARIKMIPMELWFSVFEMLPLHE